tara:strand:- start:1768 stop:2406 length:639 start_codon:yes stop_codon:yes gene_type:complete
MRLKFLPSFVKRKGRITNRQSKGLKNKDNFLILNIDDIKLLNKKYSSCHLEIGFGNAENLCSQAKSNPDILYVGCEVYQSGIGSLLASIKEDKIKNIRIFDNDIRLLIDEKDDKVFDRVIIICPDPWPKDKHHKRRLINHDFLSMISKTMKEGSEIYISTDWENYANDIRDLFLRTNFFIQAKLKNKKTFSKFERRGKRDGRTIFEFRYLKN